jgi:hypothetical protein
MKVIATSSFVLNGTRYNQGDAVEMDEKTLETLQSRGMRFAASHRNNESPSEKPQQDKRHTSRPPTVEK